MTTDLTYLPVDVNTADTSFLAFNLSTMYSDPLRACLREYIDNATDAHLEASITEPVTVTLDPGYISKTPSLAITSLVGLSPEDVVTHVIAYGNSTKRDKPELTGYYGYGSAVGLSLTDRVLFTSIKDGVRSVTHLHLTENRTIVYAQEVTTSSEPDSFTVELSLKPQDSSYTTITDFFRTAAGKSAGSVQLHVIGADPVDNVSLVDEDIPHSTLATVQLPEGQARLTVLAQVPTFPQLRIKAGENHTVRWSAFSSRNVLPLYPLIHGSTVYKLPTWAKDHLHRILNDWLPEYVLYAQAGQIVLQMPLGGITLPQHRDEIVDNQHTRDRITAVLDALEENLKQAAEANYQAHPHWLTQSRLINNYRDHMLTRTFDVGRSASEYGIQSADRAPWIGAGGSDLFFAQDALTLHAYPRSEDAALALGILKPFDHLRRLGYYAKNYAQGPMENKTVYTAKGVTRLVRSFYQSDQFMVRAADDAPSHLPVTVHHIYANHPARRSKTIDVEILERVFSTVLDDIMENDADGHAHRIVVSPEPVGFFHPQNLIFTAGDSRYIAYESLKDFLEAHGSGLADMAPGAQSITPDDYVRHEVIRQSAAEVNHVEIVTTIQETLDKPKGRMNSIEAIHELITRDSADGKLVLVCEGDDWLLYSQVIRRALAALHAVSLLKGVDVVVHRLFDFQQTRPEPAEGMTILHHRDNRHLIWATGVHHELLPLFMLDHPLPDVVDSAIKDEVATLTQRIWAVSALTNALHDARRPRWSTLFEDAAQHEVIVAELQEALDNYDQRYAVLQHLLDESQTLVGQWFREERHQVDISTQLNLSIDTRASLMVSQSYADSGHHVYNMLREHLEEQARRAKPVRRTKK